MRTLLSLKLQQIKVNWPDTRTSTCSASSRVAGATSTSRTSGDTFTSGNNSAITIFTATNGSINKIQDH